MSELKDKLTTSVFTTNAANNSAVSAAGIVTKINEKENVCTVTYAGDSGKIETAENIEVELHTKRDDWFPKVGELVKLQDINSARPIITGALIRDFVQDAKAERKYEKDVLPEQKGTVRGKING